MTGRKEALPANCPPIGLDRVEAAAYVGVSATLFDILVREGVMPPAKRLRSRRVWSRAQLDKAFAALPNDEIAGQDDVWDKLTV